jgi:hypothetical protein
VSVNRIFRAWWFIVVDFENVRSGDDLKVLSSISMKSFGIERQY